MAPHTRALGTRRPPYRAARAFYLTLFIATCLATFALFAHYHESQQGRPAAISLQKRDSVGAFQDEDEECRLVRHSHDQCHFIRKHCPADEGGFSAYLELFYCRLQHAKPVAFVILIAWLGLLFSTIGIAASDFFCINLSTIANILGMSESMAGVTLLAFGNGSPDVFSTFAAMGTGSGSLAVGELIGAAGFITAVVAGSMALIRPFQVAKKSFVRDVGFFIVAAAFSMTFMYDGRLQLWECITMVVYYVFYVAFVVVWHWLLGRRRRRREKEAAARGHFLDPSDELSIEQEEYHDDADEPRRIDPLSRGASVEDFNALERGGSIADGVGDTEDIDEEEEERDRWMSELSSNMRLSRAPMSRRNTLTPIRPSLVGALEFQAVLSGLQKSRNMQTIPMHSRRYSDDPTFTSAQQQDSMSTAMDPAPRPAYDVNEGSAGTSPRVVSAHDHLNLPTSAPGRLRAVSANDAEALGIKSGTRSASRASRSSSDLSRPLEYSRHGAGSTSPQVVSSQEGQSTLQVPSLEISQATSGPEQPSGVAGHVHFGEHLAVPGSGAQDYSVSHLSPRLISLDPSPQPSPRTVPRARQLPKIEIPRGRSRSNASTPTSSPFPPYRDDPSPIGSGPPSLMLPPPASPESAPTPGHIPVEDEGSGSRPLRWWPYSVLPQPGVLIATLFPTIYHWHEKTIWEKMLGVVAAPSVFLLTVTLPVVENTTEEENEVTVSNDRSYDSAGARSSLGGGLKSPEVEIHGGNHKPGTHHHSSLAVNGATGKGTTASVAMGTEQRNRANYGNDSNSPAIVVNEAPTYTDSPTQEVPEQTPMRLEWNRWLAMIHALLSPIFVVFSIYSQASADLQPSWLVRPVLICLGISAVLITAIIFTSTSTHRPPVYRILFSLAGFIVSIAWISTIASQVVGALKALAVILNMSHAIMGLTIFAVGNSLGDLVADVTVAKLGYPVMALSACFGGPMLNILLGIGLSGSYILIRGAEHRHHKHPKKGYKFKSYEIEVANTLIVSGITLLVTLVGLLIAVPLNRWSFSKRIGWALIVLWILSTIGNVVLEIVGLGETGVDQ